MAKLTEVQLTAIHEIGHTLIAQKHGIKVFEIVIEPGGDSGYADIDEYTAPHQVALQIGLAGFVAEELAHGREPDYKHFQTEPQYEDDRNDVADVLENMREAIAVPIAIREVTKYLTSPRVAQTSKRLAKRLARHKRIIINKE
jgi:hypothetical protein